MNFGKKLTFALRGYILDESIIDRKRNRLSEFVWDKIANNGNVVEDYRLRDDVRGKILSMVRDTFGAGDIAKAVLVGSITSHYYNNETDIDIHLFPRFTDGYKLLRQKTKEMAVVDFVGKHRLEFYIHDYIWDDPKNDITDVSAGVYDLVGDKWLVWRSTKGADIREYYDEFRGVVDDIDLNKEELRRDVIDYKVLEDALRYAAPEEVDKIRQELKGKLEEINETIAQLIIEWARLKDKRSEALHLRIDRAMSRGGPEALDKYGLTELLPGNVIYKLLQRYHYQRFIRALKDLFDDSKIEKSEIDDVGKAFERLVP